MIIHLFDKDYLSIFAQKRDGIIFCYSSLFSRCHEKFVLAQELIMTAAEEGNAGL